MSDGLGGWGFNRAFFLTLLGILVFLMVMFLMTTVVGNWTDEEEEEEELGEEERWKRQRKVILLSARKRRSLCWRAEMELQLKLPRLLRPNRPIAVPSPLQSVRSKQH